MKPIQLLIPIFLFLVSCTGQDASTQATPEVVVPKVKIGAERLLEDFPGALEGKRLGLVMNPTARIGDVHMLDTLLSLGYNISALYAPEHGFRGNFGAGEKIVDGIDEASGLKVYSLYGTTRKPTPEMLADVDALIFDMQDVGARFYTYISTLGLVLEAASEAGVEVWVLDRPNPAGGDYVAGWILEPEHTSFVGAYPIPIAHGMTMGELAKMMVGEKWIKLADASFEPNVITMQGWSRDMKWPATGLDWTPPSPNIPTWETAYVYLGTCIFEGSTLSEGRGSPTPFLTIGGPGLMIPETELNRISDTWGIKMKPTEFTPQPIPDKAPNPKHKNTPIEGVQISDDVSNLKDPVAFGFDLFRTALRSTSLDSLNSFRYRLAGTNRIDSLLRSFDNPADTWQDEVAAFKAKRKPYLLY
jgi:uncharacterized protein YbbC (DUF1343 family)